MKQWSQPHQTPHESISQRQPYHKPHTSLGATGHWVRTAGLLAPLVIGEFIKDPEKKWRYVKIAALASTLISEGMWTHKVGREREEAREREDQHRAMACEPAMFL